MSKYIKMIDKQLKIGKIEISFDVKELAEDRLEYIHALDIFMHNKVLKRVRSNNSIYAISDNHATSIRFRNGKFSYRCSCNKLCKHILATLIAFEREPDTFKDDRIGKIIDAYKRLVESMEYSGMDEDKDLLNTLHTLMITSKDDNLSQHIIGLLLISILTKIDNKYGVDAMKRANKSIAENFNSIIDAIDSEQVKSNRSWDNIIAELMKVG